MTATPADSPAGADALRRTALFAEHAALGAKTAGFGGWEMPIEYAGGGVVAEHQAVRQAAGLFDVSHLGVLTVTGPGAAAFADSCLTNALARIAPGKAQYTLCCAEDGGVVDDLILYLWGEDGVLLVPNAANAAEVRRRLVAAAPEGIRVDDLHGEMAVLAVQGPRSADVVGSLGLPTGHDHMAFDEARWQDHPVTVCRSGYTGERGYELMVPAAGAVALWRALLDGVTAHGGRADGLGARDTLRTEMGYPLHGHELGPEITPVQAGVGWAVGWDKPAFWGREALLAERGRGPARRSRGLLALGRGIPRPGMPVLAGDGTPIGTTTSGTFSPTLGQGIALALLDAAVGLDEEVAVDVRGRPLACRVVRPPFVPVNTRPED